MNRSRLLVLLAVFAVAAVALLMLSRGHDSPPPAPLPAPVVATGPADETGSAAAIPGGPASEVNVRRQEVVEQPAGDDLDDPEIRAALAGFAGRVVDARTQPVAGAGVRIYRFAADSLFRPGFDLMQESTFEPQYVAGESRTGDDGRFVITGVWPRAIYLMLAGIGSDAPTHRLLQRAPAPGEVIDLGDVVLEDAAVVTGVVVDEQDQPVAGALVRGADLPGQLVGMFPIERFDPDGCLLIRERGGPPVPVIEFPKWVKSAFERLPIPSTQSDAEGRFRLVGLVPGSNMIAVTKPGHLAKVEPTVQLKPAQVKDLGRLRLKQGEELYGKVLDTAGKPIEGAEVVAGGTLAMAPVDFGVRVGRSDQNGEFQAMGFPAGKVTVAARRDQGQPWVLAEPQPIAGTVTVTLPAQFALTIAVTTADGAPVDKPQLRLLSGGGEGRNGMMEMAMLGFLPAVELKDRLQKLEDGRLRLTGLDAGRYCLLAQGEGTAVGVERIELKADAEVTVKLPARLEYVVQVLDPEGKPIRNAAVYLEERGEGRRLDMPLCCGRTKADGKLTISQAHSESIRVSAEHPRWGSVHGECTAAQGGIVLRMQAPGGIEGVVSEDRQPAAAGKYTIAVMLRQSTRGAIEDIPQLLANGADGKFALRALQPGRYHLQLVKSLDAISSPGGVYGFAQTAMFANDLPGETVEVLPGQTAQVALDASPQVLTGPSGHVYGMVTIDGRPGVNCTVMSWGERRAGARTDAAGRFDLGRLPAGQVNVNVSLGGDMFDEGERYNHNFELKDGEEKELLIDIQTGVVSGWIAQADGSPAVGIHVGANGQLFDSNGKTEGMGHTWTSTRTDQDGAFRFDKLPIGRYSIEARAGEGGGRARVENLELRAGQTVTDVRLQLAPAVKVSGRVELAVLGNQKPQWIWIQFMARSKPDDPSSPFERYVGSAGCNREDGRFSTEELPPGTYRVRLYTANDNQPQQRYEHQAEVVVPPQGLSNLILVPVLVPERQGR